MQILEIIKSHLDIIYILILSIFIGVEVIKNIPAVLHTPLMSGANILNVVGGFVVTNRMLEMFKKKKS